MINLFKQKGDPIELSQAALSYRVVPDSRHPRSIEIYSIDRVFSVNRRQQSTEYHPFFAIRHAADTDERMHYWYPMRQRIEDAPDGDEGTEVDISFVDLNFDPASPPDSIVNLELTCLNRDLPNQLPFGGGQPRLHLRSGGPIQKVECLTAPTKTHRKPLGNGMMWRLVSHLTMNHLTLTGGEDAAASLREMLKLYDVVDSAESRAKLKSIVSVSSRRSTFPRAARSAGQLLPRHRNRHHVQSGSVLRQRHVPVRNGDRTVSRLVLFDQFSRAHGRAREAKAGPAPGMAAPRRREDAGVGRPSEIRVQ
jgi:type VI secretion system protein ImpG